MPDKRALGSYIVGNQGAEAFGYRLSHEVHPYGSLMWAMDHSRAVRALVCSNAILLGVAIALVLSGCRTSTDRGQCVEGRTRPAWTQLMFHQVGDAKVPQFIHHPARFVCDRWQYPNGRPITAGQ